MEIQRQPHILIIDNDNDLVRGLARRLTANGYHCQTAASGGQGLSKFFFSDVDLIITDLNMPYLDGIALIDKIRQHSDVPIVIMTGFRKDYTHHLNNLKDITIIQKPFESQQLADLVAMELNLHRTRQAS